MTESTGARGRLAQMIATRSGLAPPEEPFVIEHREALIYMLCEAAEHLALLPFGEEALRHFMFLERPEGMDIKDAEGMAAFEKAVPAAMPCVQVGEIVPRGQDFATVGHLYRSIEAGIAHLAEKFG